MKELSTDIDLDLEVRHLASYIAQKWTPIAGLEDMFRDIRDAALRAARAWLQSHVLSLRAHELSDERRAMLKSVLPTLVEQETADTYDSVSHLLFKVSILDSRIREAGQNLEGHWSYGAWVTSLVRKMRSNYPDLARARPLGWEALESNYTDFDGQEEYDPAPDRALFQGVNTEGACSGDFVYRTALPYVMYDDKCQGNKPCDVLVGAVFAHFLTIREYLNTQRAVSALEELVAAQPEWLMVGQEFKTDNPHLQVVLALMGPAPTEAEYREALAQRRRYEQLSDEEKAARQAQSSESIMEIVAQLRSEGDERRREEDAAALRAMREAFPR